MGWPKFFEDLGRLRDHNRRIVENINLWEAKENRIETIQYYANEKYTEQKRYLEKILEELDAILDLVSDSDIEKLEIRRKLDNDIKILSDENKK